MVKWMAAGALWGLCLTGWAAGDEDPQQMFQTTFGPEAQKVAKTPTAEDDLEFAAKLLDGARKAVDAPVFQAFLCDKAVEFTSKSLRGYPTAKEALEFLAKVAPDKKGKAQERLVEVCESYYRASRKAKDKKRAGSYLTETLLSLADSELAADMAPQALRLYQKALTVARSSRSHLEHHVRQKLKAAQAMQASDRQLARLEAALKANPKNVSSAKRAVMLCVLEKDRPGKAKKYLGHLGGEDDLKAHVLLAAADPSSLDEQACLKLRDWYRDLARRASNYGKVTALKRAKAYCQGFLELHSLKDDKNLAAEGCLDQIAKELIAAQWKVNGGWLDLLQIADPRKDVARGRTWTAHNGELVCEKSWTTVLLVPYQPPAEYDLQVCLTRKSGRDRVGLVGVFGNKQFACLLGGEATKSGLELVDSCRPSKNPTGRELHLTNNLRYTILLQVRRSVVRVCLDGEPVIELKPGPDTLSPAHYLPSAATSVGLVAEKDPVVFHSFCVKEISGGGRYLKRESKPK